MAPFGWAGAAGAQPQPHALQPVQRQPQPQLRSAQQTEHAECG